jgi:hypothetical protein
MFVDEAKIKKLKFRRNDINIMPFRRNLSLIPNSLLQTFRSDGANIRNLNRTFLSSNYLPVQTLSLGSESGNLPYGSRVILLILRFPKSSVT